MIDFSASTSSNVFDYFCILGGNNANFWRHVDICFSTAFVKRGFANDELFRYPWPPSWTVPPPPLNGAYRSRVWLQMQDCSLLWRVLCKNPQIYLSFSSALSRVHESPTHYFGECCANIPSSTYLCNQQSTPPHKTQNFKEVFYVSKICDFF